MKLQLQPTATLTYRKAEKTKITGLNVLKLLCAFFVVHAHVDCLYTDWVYSIVHIAVPIFFMISGYFLCDDSGVIQTGHIKKIIKHMIPVIIFVNLIYFLYSLIPEPYGHSCKLDQLSSPNTWVLLIYPGSSFFHPGWYLNAYIIALCVIALLVKLHCDKLLYVWIFIGLFINFAFGALAFTWLDNANATFLGIEYSKISLILNRNFYTIALPFIAMGLFVRRNQKHLARMAASKYMYVAVVLLLVAGVAEHMWQKSINPAIFNTHLFTPLAAMSLFLFALPRFKANRWQNAANYGQRYSASIYYWHLLVNYIILESLLQPLAPTFFSDWGAPICCILSLLLAMFIYHSKQKYKTIPSWMG